MFMFTDISLIINLLLLFSFSEDVFLEFCILHYLLRTTIIVIISCASKSIRVIKQEKRLRLKQKKKKKQIKRKNLCLDCMM